MNEQNAKENAVMEPAFVPIETHREMLAALDTTNRRMAKFAAVGWLVAVLFVLICALK